MNSQKVAAALNTISLAFAELAEAIHSPESGTLPAAGGVTGDPPLATPPEFPPLESWEEAVAAPAAPPVDQREYVLSRCPTHDKPWTVKEGGMSKNGKPYSAFWKCAGKNPDGSFCNKKPDASWVKTHDPEAELVGA